MRERVDCPPGPEQVKTNSFSRSKSGVVETVMGRASSDVPNSRDQAPRPSQRVALTTSIRIRAVRPRATSGVAVVSEIDGDVTPCPNKAGASRPSAAKPTLRTPLDPNGRLTFINRIRKLKEKVHDELMNKLQTSSTMDFTIEKNKAWRPLAWETRYRISVHQFNRI